MTSKVPSEVQDVLEEANKEEVARLFLSLNNYSLTDPKIIKKLKSVEIDPDTFVKASRAVVVNYYKKSTVPAPDFIIEHLPIEVKSKNADPMAFSKIHQFLNTFTTHINQYGLTPMQLKVLSFIGFRSELSGSQPDLTMTSIKKDLGLNFTTVQRCIEKLGDGYTYKFPNGKEVTKEGSGLVKHEKPEKVGGREGSISITVKGRRFLEDIGRVVSDYSTPPVDHSEAILKHTSNLVTLTAKQANLIQKLGQAMRSTNFIDNFITQGGEKKNVRRKSK